MPARIVAPGYTQIPNSVLDEASYELSHPAFKILCFITRKTFGWHKECDKIPYSQIMNGCAVSRDGAATALKELEDGGWILVQHNKAGNVYKLHVDDVVCLADYSSLPSGLQGSLPSGHSKETTKERIKKEKHPKFGVPIGVVRYKNLIAEHTQKVVDAAIQNYLDWEASKGRGPSKDYAAAAANWLSKAESYRPKQEKKCSKERDGWLCNKVLVDGKCPECDR